MGGGGGGVMVVKPVYEMPVILDYYSTHCNNV